MFKYHFHFLHCIVKITFLTDVSKILVTYQLFQLNEQLKVVTDYSEAEEERLSSYLQRQQNVMPNFMTEELSHFDAV
jgi:hypothetical protein